MARLVEVFGDSERLATAKDLSRLTYLDAVIKETLRLYIPVPVIVRDCDQDTVLPSSINIPGNSVLLINIWGIHRNPKYWGEDAEEYRPERFLEGPLKHPVQFLPFSNGPRNCLGYKYAMTSMKMALSTILRRFKLLPESSDPCYLHKPIRVKFEIMMKDVDGFPVKLEYRQPFKQNL